MNVTWTEDADGVWTCSNKDCVIRWYSDDLKLGTEWWAGAGSFKYCPRCGGKIVVFKRSEAK
jgi:hypothetical protein